jgi:translation initiation factor 1
MNIDPGLDNKDFNFDELDTDKAKKEITGSQANTEIHIRIQQRTSRKCLTIIQGLPPKLDLKKVLKYFKRKFCCNGIIIEDATNGNILQITGDQRANVEEFLVTEKIARKEQIKVHGM